MGIKLSDLGAHGAEDSVLLFVGVHTESVVTGVWWWRKRSTAYDAGQRHEALASQGYINTDGQDMKRKC